MDDKGFIFSTDAALALVIFMVFTTSFITYQILPYYMGNDHQHLESLADSALAVMEQDGTLNKAAIYYAGGNNSMGSQTLNSSLDQMIPSDVGYKITLGSYPPVLNNRNLLYSNDVVTRVRVISGPQEGWVGRAWYKLEEVQFENKTQNVTTTLWNFHNWLENFSPWNSNGINNRPYWGWRSGTPSYQTINFSIPNNVTIGGGMFLLGSGNRQTDGRSYGANVVINGVNRVISNSSFNFLNYIPDTTRHKMYNYRGIINSTNFVNGTNNFYVNFINVTSTMDMPWFSIIGNYTTTLELPKGITTDRIPFIDAAGLAVPNSQNLGIGNGYGFSYDLDTGNRTLITSKRSIAWNSFLNRDNSYSDGIPFVMTGVPNVGTVNGISVTQNVYIPPNSRIFDGFTVVNGYGALDNALVEVWDGTRWNTVFCSFDLGGVDYSDRSDGYGNIPGIIYIKDYLHTGNNKVRITVWDVVPGDDYDLVGLESSYSQVTYSKLPINWENFQFASKQSATNQPNLSRTRSFTIGADAQKVLLFVGAGLDTRRITVDYNNNQVLYDSNVVPYSLDISKLDAEKGFNRITSGGPGNFTLKNGTYTLRVNITASNAWESGDGWGDNPTYANAEIFSGTRVSVLYPKFLENVWTTAYADDAATAQDRAYNDLVDLLNSAGIDPDPDLIRKEAMYAGDLPNAIPVRLELWRK